MSNAMLANDVKEAMSFSWKMSRNGMYGKYGSYGILNKMLTSMENEFDFLARVTTNFLQKSACSAEPEK